MSLLSNQTGSPESNETTDSFDVATPPFIPGQCLFCPHPSPNFSDSVTHMQKSHGLFVPHRQHLLVDLETLFKYLHLVIFGYRECIQCGTERVAVQAVQQHMTSKGHCTFDISEPDSEFAEFYDFPETEDGTESGADGEVNDKIWEATAGSARRKPLLVDEDSIRLPSGKIISKRSATQTGPSFSQRHRIRFLVTQLELPEPDDNKVSSKEEAKFDARDGRILSKRKKRERAAVVYRAASMSTNDRNSLVHLPASQQRAILATQHRNAEKVQKDERRRQGKIDRKGNKNLYAYWATETPVYQCG